MKKDYLEELENDETIMRIYYDFYMNVVTAIVHNVGNINNISDNDLRKYIKKTSKDIYNKTNDEVLKVNNGIKKDLSNKYKKSAGMKLNSMKDIYEYKNVPLIMTKTQLDIVNDAVSKTFKEIKKLNSKLPSKAKQDYINCVNQYSKELVNGDITFNDALKKATQEVRRRGITTSYKRKDGKVVNVEPDVAVRRNLLGNMSEVGNEISENVAEELGADGAETSAHSGARPTHQVWQGRQFALSAGGKIVDGVYYEPFSNYSDELYDYNCRHSWTPIILGISSSAYSSSELDKMNGNMVKYNGKMISEYEGTQIQRRLENQIRHTKREIELLKKTGLDYDDENKKLQNQYKRYREASKEMGLDQKYNRLRTF